MHRRLALGNIFEGIAAIDIAAMQVLAMSFEQSFQDNQNESANLSAEQTHLSSKVSDLRPSIRRLAISYNEYQAKNVRSQVANSNIAESGNFQMYRFLELK